MTSPDEKLRFNAVDAEAERLGYRIAVDLVPHTEPQRYSAFAHRLVGEQTSVGSLLCSRASAIEAAEDGLEVLRTQVADQPS